MQIINPALRAERTSAPAVRSVTVLGATGSIGLSTVDLLKRGDGQYRVEAVTANKNAADLAKIARELGALSEKARAGKLSLDDMSGAWSAQQEGRKAVVLL